MVFHFKLVTLQPGSREYNQGIFYPETNVIVAVDVPLKYEYIFNAEEIIMAETGFADGTIPEPVLTVKGWAYIEDQFLNRAVETEEEALKSEYSDDDFIKE